MSTPENKLKKDRLKQKRLELVERTLYFWIAILIFIIAAVVLFKNLHKWDLLLVADENKGDVTTAIYAMPGFLATVAGLLLVLDNLILQRRTLVLQIEANEILVDDLDQQITEWKESTTAAKDQNNTLIKQQADNTFFNLISFYTNRISELNKDSFFLKEMRTDKEGYHFYRKSLIQHRFSSIYSTLYNPYFYFSRNSTDRDNETFIALAVGAKDIIDFIEEKLNSDAEFYHRIFFNQLKPEIRFYIGLFVEFGLFNLKNFKSFDYSKYYRSELHYNNKTISFPALQSTFNQTEFGIVNLNSSTAYTTLASLTINPAPLILERATIEVQDEKKSGLWNTIKIGNGEPIEIDYDLDIKESLEFISRLNETQSLKLMIIWQFNYMNTTFYIEQSNAVHFLKDDKIVIKQNY